MKSSKASFKVTLTHTKHKLQKSPKKFRRHLQTKENTCASTGVNLYMTYAKPKLIPKPPQIILNLIEVTKTSLKGLEPTEDDQGIRKVTTNEGCTGVTSKSLRERGKKKKLNPFIGFRSYYANCVKGKIKQQDLSILLSSYWSTNNDVHKTWEFFTQHYNKHDTGMCFTEWLEKNYKCEHQSPAESNSTNITREPFIEDIFSQPDDFLKRFTSRELLDMTNLHFEYQDLLNITFEEHFQSSSTNALIGSYMQSDDPVYF
ncbi:LANO_0G00232g1_1 [Lachancea nothofagi CBS 11611]|uniref:LANO_0G00232g1_1 n=1 Tax=Lachancea nothofagi CBS 11611 TaxID=1266666 RepID=A0A1G4KEA7_9SACH|nr:LANO_0G00232g1_1 [Lachancea nothofagi CBS 11611]